VKKIIIAIDPDVDKSGVAVWEDDNLEICSWRFGDFINYISIGICDNSDLIFIVESGWLNKSNWHKTKGMTIASVSKIGEKIGANHQVGKLIVEICKYYGIETIEQKPLSKIWGKGKDKISHEELSYFVPNLPKRTNQEERDAILLLWNYLKKPIKKMPNK